MKNNNDMDLSYVLTDYVTLILLILFVVALAMVSVYYGMFFLKVGRSGRTKKDLAARLKAHEEGTAQGKMPPVSVVMVAHNEGMHLRDNLVYLLEQDYPSYEVVVVDYKSTDDTKFILQVCAQNYPHLNVVQMSDDVNMFQGRKFPLSVGIRSAKNDIVVLTEPECRPVGFSWLRSMSRGYTGADKKIVLGYCAPRKEKGFLNLLQQYESLVFSAQYLGAAMMGRPYTATGNNLSYRRKFFFAQGAFTSHYTEEYGADDLFVNQNATSKNTSVCFDEDARVEVDPKKSFGQWHLQRKHRVRTYRLHSWAERLSRLMSPLSVLLFYCALILLVLKGFPWYILVGVLLLKFVWQIVTFAQLGKQFGVKHICWFSPLLEIYFIVADTILSISALKK